MLGFFADFYPDEIFYSACARYSDRMHYLSQRDAYLDLIGRFNSRISIELPSNLTNFLNNLPPNHEYTLDSLLKYHTMLPFYAPFLSEQRVIEVINAMSTKESYNSFVVTRTPNYISKLNSLQYCPVCITEDEKLFGEPYWHRVHQFPFVKFCPTHLVALEQEQSSAEALLYSYKLISAKTAIKSIPNFRIATTTTLDKILVKITKDVAWMLNNPLIKSSLKIFKHKYYLLWQKNFGRLNSELLSKNFIEYYSEDLLYNLGCNLDKNINKNWLYRLFLGRETSQHPLYHLLLIYFFGYDIKTFLELDIEEKPFGKGPWSCLNPVCPDYCNLTIKEYVVEYTRPKGKRPGIPRGIFSCKCGYSYTRLDSDQVLNGEYQVRVRSYGSLWETKLEMLWNDPNISVYEMARQLKVDRRTIKLQADRLGLIFPPPGSPHLVLSQRSKSKISFEKFEEKRRINRDKWLSLREQFPEWGRKKLSLQDYKLYQWLYNNDSDWFKANSPVFGGNSVVKKWESIDVELAQQVKVAAEYLRSSSDPPVKVTIKAIGTFLGKSYFLTKKRGNLPITAKVVNEVVDTQEMYALRCIEWASKIFDISHTRPTPAHLLKKAGISLTNLKFSSVEKAVSHAISYLLDEYC